MRPFNYFNICSTLLPYTTRSRPAVERGVAEPLDLGGRGLAQSNWTSAGHIHSAWQCAQDRRKWQTVVETATLPEGHAT